MMNSKRVQSFTDPLIQGKMARLEGTVGTIVPPGLPRMDDLPHYSQDKSLPYRRTYMSCSLGDQEHLDHPSTWSPSRTYVINGGSPVVHPPPTEGSITNPVFYRPENEVFPVDSRSPAATEELAVKHKLAYYNRSKHGPSATGVVSPVALRKLPIGCTNLSPSTADGSVGLAIPKPVYGHRPCCSDRKCTVGQNYAVEQGLQRVPPQMIEDDWAAHYGHWVYMHKKEQEALMQQRTLPIEQCGERVPLKDVTTQGYHGHSSSRTRRVTAFTEPSHSSYPYSSAHAFVPASPEHCQRFQMQPQMHKDLPPMYNPLARLHYGTRTQVNQDHASISKYGEVLQHSLLYCPQNNTEVYRPENPQHIVEKHASGHCPIPQPYYTDLPNPYSMIPTNHPAVRNLATYSSYRMHLNNSQVNQFTERPCAPSIMHQTDRPLDFSMRREHNADSHQEPHGQFGTSGTFHRSHVPNHSGTQNTTVGPSDQSQDDRPVSSIHNYIVSPQCTGDISNEKRGLNNSDSSGNGALIYKRHREESDIHCEATSLEKVQKMDQQKTDETQSASSPPLPVIKKVFSLAPYKAYLEAAGMFSPAQEPNGSTPQAASDPPKKEPETQNTDPKTVGQSCFTLRAVKTPPVTSRDSDDLQTQKIKEETAEPREISCESGMNDTKSVISQDCVDGRVKDELADFEPTVCDPEHHIVTVKSDFESECKPVTPEISVPSPESKTELSSVEKVETVQIQNITINASNLPATLPPEAHTLPQTPHITFSLSKIPPHCLKLSSHNIIVPDVLKTPVPPSPEIPQPPVVTRPAISSSRQARYQFMELHQSLCRLISACVSQTSHLELRQWLSSLDLDSPPAKTQKVSCLLGSKARVWLKGEETVKALKKVICKLECYVITSKCPFLHVMRAGAVFIPMLVVKEVLFPQVQGTFIDQILQDHRVELRPTTLSEERHLTQLHRQAFSSKLRRLLSLKHLPEIYPDVLNLLYYTSACKFLGLELDSPIKRECAESSDEAEGTVNELEINSTSMRPQTPDGVTYLESIKEMPCLKKHTKSKGRVKSACKRMFLADDSSSHEDEPAEESTGWCFENSLEVEEWENVPVACSDEADHVEVKIEEDTEQEPENSWGRPLTSDDLSSENSEAETEVPFWSSGQSTNSFSKSHSRMVLKLRKVYYTNSHQGRVSHYQRVMDNTEAQDTGSGDDGRRHHRKKERRISKLKQHTLSPRVHRPQDCSYLSSQRVSKHRWRWALRSATRNAQQAMSSRYPNLVGKRIRHLYEENDKREVWYRGVVLRIHEPHPNPLKTVFEVKYDSEPEWQYYLELLADYKKGWLKIED